jgi:hypothetical protein
MHKIIKFFDHLEDIVREHLSRFPITYGIIGGVFVVLFWRGVWHTADQIEAAGGVLGDLFSGPISIVLSIAVLLITGLLVSVFIGDHVIMSGLKHEKKIADKTEMEVREEEKLLNVITTSLSRIEKELAELREKVK